MPERETHRVLVVDDEPAVRSAHARLVESLGYVAEAAEDGVEALAKLVLGIDLVLLDIDMPHMDGFEVATRMRAESQYGHIPIIMVTGLVAPAYHRRAMEVGANDVIQKPISLEELRIRSFWLLKLKDAYDRLMAANIDLGASVTNVTQELREALDEVTEAERRIYAAHLDTIRRLTIAAEYKDEFIRGHIERVGLSAAVLARAVGFSPRQVDMIRHAAPMHDVGKIGVPDEVLLKRGKLDEGEMAIMREHTRIGASLLAGSDSDVIQMGAEIALHHHEHWDGTGYPYGLVGEKIPFEARVCGVVDYFDATTMERPHRPPLSQDWALDSMTEQRGERFDPALLDAFFDCLHEIRQIREEYPVQ